MSALRDWECLAHGVFEARTVSAQTVPKCPKGCSRSLVKLVHLRAPGHVSARTRTGDRLLREAADGAGLSDISTSPSRPGGSVAQRNRMKLRGPKGREYPDVAKALPVDFGKYIGALTHQANELTNLGFGHAYDASQWKSDKETGRTVHTAAPPPVREIPVNSVGVSIERVKEKK
jgi:hypothetical protein